MSISVSVCYCFSVAVDSFLPCGLRHNLLASSFTVSMLAVVVVYVRDFLENCFPFRYSGEYA